MAKHVICEIYSVHGQLQERLRFDKVPISIGRGYQNDVIVNDPFVSPFHCTVEVSPEGDFIINDQKTLNQLSMPHSLERAERIVMSSGTSFIIGETQIQLAFADTPVPDALPLRREKAVRHAPSWVGMVCGLLALSALTLYIFSYNVWFSMAYDFQDGSQEALSLRQVFFYLLPILIYSGVWAVIGRISKHRAAFFIHFSLASVAILWSMLANDLCNWLSYGYNAPQLAENLDLLLFTLAIILLFYRSFYLATNVKKQNRWAYSGSIGAIVAFLIIISGYLQSKAFQPSPVLKVELWPSSFRRAPLNSPEIIMAELKELKDAVDGEAQR